MSNGLTPCTGACFWGPIQAPRGIEEREVYRYLNAPVPGETIARAPRPGVTLVSNCSVACSVDEAPEILRGWGF